MGGPRAVWERRGGRAGGRVPGKDGSWGRMGPGGRGDARAWCVRRGASRAGLARAPRRTSPLRRRGQGEADWVDCGGRRRGLGGGVGGGVGWGRGGGWGGGGGGARGLCADCGGACAAAGERDLLAVGGVCRCDAVLCLVCVSCFRTMPACSACFRGYFCGCDGWLLMLACASRASGALASSPICDDEHMRWQHSHCRESFSAHSRWPPPPCCVCSPPCAHPASPLPAPLDSMRRRPRRRRSRAGPHALPRAFRVDPLRRRGACVSLADPPAPPNHMAMLGSGRGGL